MQRVQKQNSLKQMNITVISVEELKQLLLEILRQERAISSPPIQSPPEFMTIDDAADYLKMSKSALYQFTSKRTIPQIKRGRRLYFKKSDLEGWLDEGKRKTRQELEEITFAELSKSKRK